MPRGHASIGIRRKDLSEIRLLQDKRWCEQAIANDVIRVGIEPNTGVQSREAIRCLGPASPNGSRMLTLSQVFSIKGVSFMSTLTYWQGDAHAARHEKDFAKLLGSVQPAGYSERERPQATQSETRKPAFRRASVESILTMGDRTDRKPVELYGRVTTGPETSIFTDSSKCTGLRVSGCSIWVELNEHCTLAGGESSRRRCDRAIEELARRQPTGWASGLFGVDNVTVRGIVLTVKRDVKYDKSLPKSFRLGFGHLSAYPAQIDVVEIEIGSTSGELSRQTRAGGING